MNTLLTSIINPYGRKKDFLLNLNTVVGLEPHELAVIGELNKIITCTKVITLGNQDILILDENFDELVELLHNKE